MSVPFRYQSPDEDSARWLGFPFRDDDIVISSRSKTGTTWVQMICALLIFQTPQLPAPLAQLSPWLDHLIAAPEQVYARLAAQDHRRFIKTHTPLDGIPVDPRATYIVTARHPLDMAVSLYHQGDNIDRARLWQLTGQPEPASPPPLRQPLHEWLLEWIANDADPREYLDSLPGVMWHLSDAWARRNEPNVLLVHYDNLSADLEGQMRWLAGQLGIAVPAQAWPSLVQAAMFENMSARADTLVPTAGILKSNAAFFRRGTSGEGRQILSDEEVAAYYACAAQLAPTDMLTWLHSAGITLSAEVGELWLSSVGDFDPLVGAVDGHGATARNDVLRFGVAEVDPEDHRDVGVILGYRREHGPALLGGKASLSRRVVALAI